MTRGDGRIGDLMVHMPGTWFVGDNFCPAMDKNTLKAVADWATDQEHIEKEGNLYYLISSDDCQKMFNGEIPEGRLDE